MTGRFKQHITFFGPNISHSDSRKHPCFPPAANFVTDDLKSYGQKGRHAVPPSHHRTAHSWQRSGNPIQRNKIPLLCFAKGEVRVVSVCEPWRRVRSSLFTGSSRWGCCCERHRKVWRTEKEESAEWKTLQRFSILWSPTSPCTRRLTSPLSSLLSSHHISRGKWDSLCHEDGWSPLTSATEALASKIATGPFCLCSFFWRPLISYV